MWWLFRTQLHLMGKISGAKFHWKHHIDPCFWSHCRKLLIIIKMISWVFSEQNCAAILLADSLISLVFSKLQISNYMACKTQFFSMHKLDGGTIYGLYSQYETN